MSPTIDTLDNAQPGFPRVSGDEPMPTMMHVSESWFSPRERG